MKYRTLDAALVDVAEAARKLLAKRLGVPRFRADHAIADDSSYTPTLFGEASDHGLVAIEVNGGSYTTILDEFILNCYERQMPLRFFVAFPEGANGSALNLLLKKAKKRGVGAISVNDGEPTQLFGASPLSLFGLRRIEPKRFPAAYLPRLFKAEETFLEGDPVKGCGRLYDLLEAHSRAVAVAFRTRGCLKPTGGGVPVPPFRANTAWNTVLEIVEKHGDFDAMKQHGLRLKKPLWNRVRGITPHRNESGHEPADKDELQMRDRELRTRFEHASDTLAELVAVSGGLVVP